jgi:hypothetical protein
MEFPIAECGTSQTHLRKLKIALEWAAIYFYIDR